MSDRICVYTVLVGGYERLLEQPVAARGGVDLICFTDDMTISTKTWQLRRFEPTLATDPNRSSRRPKILAHEYLPDYDVSLYIDNTVLLIDDPRAIIARFLRDDASMAIFRHSFRDTVRDEFEVVTQIGRDARWVFEEQLQHYLLSAPESLSAPALWGGMLFRRHHDPSVRAAMTIWWEQLLRYSRRDQLSLPHALRRAGLDITVHDVDNHNSDVHSWPRMAERGSGTGPGLPPGPEQEIQQLRAELDGERLRVIELEGENAHVRAQLTVALTESAELGEQVTGLASSLGAERARLVDSELTNRECEHQLVAMTSEMVAAKLAANLATESAVARTEEILGSTSWRLTAPLRWVGRIRPALRARRARADSPVTESGSR